MLGRAGCSEVGGWPADQRYQRCLQVLTFRFHPFEQCSNAPSLASRRLLFPLLCSAALFAVDVVCRHCGRLAKQRSSQKRGQRQLPGSGGSVSEAGLGCLQVRVGVDAWLGEAEDRHEEQRGERQRQQAKTRQLRVHIVVNK